MSGKTLEQQIAEMKQSFLAEELLDDHWSQVESLEDEDNPNFVEDFTNLFFSGIARDIVAVEKDLEADQVDFPIILEWFNKITGSSSSIGMVTITTKSKKAESFCEQENLEGIKETLNELKEEVETMKEKLEAYFELLELARFGK